MKEAKISQNNTSDTAEQVEKSDDAKPYIYTSKSGSLESTSYVQGQDIHVAPGQEQHLPHEAWYVAQQMAGRVEPTTEVGGMPVNDNVGLEEEADIMGARANIF